MIFNKAISYIVTAVLFMLSALGLNNGHQLSEKRLRSNFNSSIEAAVDDGSTTGCQVYVRQQGEDIINKTYGTKSIGGESLNGNEVYRIASMTKPITAAALMIEQERGHLNIYDDVSKYLPEYGEMYVGETQPDGSFKAAKKAANSIKVYMLVSHCSGIGAGEIGNTLLFSAMSKSDTAEELVDNMANEPLVFEPGTSQSYSNASFEVAARIIEITSGMEFEEYLKVNIFDKLGMVDTTFSPTDEQYDRMVAARELDSQGNAVNNPQPRDTVFSSIKNKYHFAAGGLASTASDYMKFAQMLLNNGVGENGVRILSDASVKEMATPKVGEDIMGGSERWGLGMRVIVNNNGRLPKGTFGWSGAYGTHFWVDPVNEITAVYMVNTLTVGGYGTSDFERDVMGALTLKCLK